MAAPHIFSEFSEFYQDKRRILMFILIFFIIFFAILAMDMALYPPPPEISFIDGDSFVIGDVYIDGEPLGRMASDSFGGLPDSYCYGIHKIELETEAETFSWSSNYTHCKYNSVKFFIER